MGFPVINLSQCHDSFVGLVFMPLAVGLHHEDRTLKSDENVRFIGPSKWLFNICFIASDVFDGPKKVYIVLQCYSFDPHP